MGVFIVIAGISFLVSLCEASTTGRVVPDHIQNDNYQDADFLPLFGASVHYSYNVCSIYAPRYWGDYWEGCKGSQNWDHVLSPINIDTNNVEYGKDYEVKYEDEDLDVIGKFSNNGHTALFTARDTTGTGTNLKIIKGVPKLEDIEYAFIELHMHIGSHVKGSACHDYVDSNTGNNPGGSEHAVDNEYFEGEMHLVHWRKDDASSTYDISAQDNVTEDGLFAIGIFFEVDPSKAVNEEAELIIQNYVSAVKHPGTATPQVTVNPAKLLPDDKRFYTYEGTKTTPPCNDNVRFVVYKTPIYISQASYDILKYVFTNEDTATVHLTEFGVRCPIWPQEEEVEVAANFEEP